MADVLKSLWPTEASSSAQQGKLSPDQTTMLPLQQPQKETVAVDRTLTEEMRMRLMVEQEKTR